MSLNYLLLVAQPLEKEKTRICIGNLADFIQQWAIQRHNFPTFCLFFERDFVASFPEMEALAPMVLQEVKDRFGLQPTKDNTAIIFLGKPRVSTPNGSSPDGYINTMGPENTLEGYVQIDEVRDADMLIKSPEIYWNAGDGYEIIHEYLHIILLRKGLQDRIDEHRQEREYWLMSEKFPLYGLNPFSIVERIDDKYPVVPVSNYPGINWNFVCQAYSDTW